MAVRLERCKKIRRQSQALTAEEYPGNASSR